VAVLIDSPGPVLYRSRRIGRDGVPFWMLKFRTMKHLAGGPLISSKTDHRFTPVGRYLALTRLDELPQLFNVLRGEMSLVGPRPPLAYEVERYEPWQHERLSVRPGITGLWQVSGRNRLSYVDMIRLDITYAREWSFRRDLVIALKTPWTMFIARGGAS
jgi:lipopolysaccharide/colanic/teichoic acid biosynthesis glycosyltransferase